MKLQNGISLLIMILTNGNDAMIKYSFLEIEEKNANHVVGLNKTNKFLSEFFIALILISD